MLNTARISRKLALGSHWYPEDSCFATFVSLLAEIYVQQGTKPIVNRRHLLSALAVLPVWGTGCLGQLDTSADGGGGQSGSGASINDTKLQLEGYQDHEKAIEDGYRNTGTCLEGLGTLFVRDDVTQISYDVPNVLL